MLSILGCQEKVTVEDLKKFVAIKDYPNVIFLDTVSNKKALIIVAHDDDDCAMAGTIAKLTAKDWTITQLSLQRNIIPKTGKNPANIICKGNDVILQDGYYRIGLDRMENPYLPIPYANIKEQFLIQKVSGVLITEIIDFKTFAIFILDNEKGGYRHAEHIFISQLVKHLFAENKINCQKLYQSVYTKHMEKEIVDKWLGERMKKWGYPNARDIANKMYHISGMPEPTTQVNILEVAETKKKVSYGL